MLGCQAQESGRERVTLQVLTREWQCQLPLQLPHMLEYDDVDLVLFAR
jgi:hypothetical protein